YKPQTATSLLSTRTKMGDKETEKKQEQAAQQQPQQEQPKEHHKTEKAKEFGKRLGDSTIFGAGATIGNHIVDSIL
ncbi:hypothetical protein OGATHE_001499, partial [Ogataea polymorpha]